MENIDPNKLPSKAKTDSQRCKEYRDIKKLKALGMSGVPLLDQAKAELRASADLDLERVVGKEPFIGAFDASALTQLRIFIKNHKASRKKLEAEELERAKEQLNTEARAQRIGNDEIAELDRILLNASSEDEHI